MRRTSLLLLVALTSISMLAGCGKKNEEIPVETLPALDGITVTEETEETPNTEAVEEETREGMYRSELTNEWLDESIKNQRPIAAMVDNEKTALPHYGLSTADIVYEMTNSTANDGITRFMVLVKDWAKIEQLGSIRSVRPTNLQIAPEWNAIVCHDGGPFYINPFLANEYVDNFSGTFSRVNNGKPREFTEYILPGDMEKNFKNNSKVSSEYNEHYAGAHYQFATESNQVNLSSDSNSQDCTYVKMPFRHNNPFLEYNEEEGLYYYSEYGAKHIDPGNNNQQLAFKNLLIQSAELHELDDHGYMLFNPIATGRDGYYVTNGKVIPVTWSKEADTLPTRYYDMDGNEITINTGKTYVAIVPSEDFGDIEFK